MKAYDTVSKSVFNENGLDLGESVFVGFDRTINVFIFYFFGKSRYHIINLKIIGQHH